MSSQRKVRDDIARDVVDAVKNIVAEETEPLKKSQKRRNAAEQFVDEHESEFTKPKQSDDRMNTVKHHYRTTPRLDDVIEKRESLIKITTIKAGNLSGDFDVHCSACAQLATLKALKKLHLKPKCTCKGCSRSRPCNKNSSGSKSYRRSRSTRCRDRLYHSRNSKKTTQKDKLVGIDKNKNKTRMAFKSLNLRSSTYLVINKTCQCSLAGPGSRASVHGYSDEKHEVRTFSSIPNDFTAKSNVQLQQTCDRSQTLQLHYKDPSVSSYNSYYSFNHEPMDENP